MQIRCKHKRTGGSTIAHSNIFTSQVARSCLCDKKRGSVHCYANTETVDLIIGQDVNSHNCENNVFQTQRKGIVRKLRRGRKWRGWARGNEFSFNKIMRNIIWLSSEKLTSLPSSTDVSSGARLCVAVPGIGFTSRKVYLQNLCCVGAYLVFSYQLSRECWQAGAQFCDQFSHRLH